MSWHEPGRDRDPWRSPEEGPPDLDEWLRRAHRRLRDWFRHAPRPPGLRHFRVWWLVPIILVGVWLATGFYRVPASHKAINQRFGAYAGLAGPGLHWHWPWPIATERLVDLSEGRSISRHAQVFTRDGKLATVRLTVAYRISDPREYLFGSRDPIRLIGALADIALARVAREKDLETLRADTAGALDQSLKTRIADGLKAARVGVTVQSVSIGHIELPDMVQESRHALAQAKKDNAQRKQKAQAAAKQTVLAAGRKAEQLIADAERAATRRETLARERAARFKALLPAWRKAPGVTRETLRADTLAGVLGGIPKVVVSGSVHNVTLPPWPATAAASVATPAGTTKAVGAPRGNWFQ